MGSASETLLNLFKRCSLVQVQGDDGHHRVQVRATAGEIRDDIEVMQPYGLTSHPIAAADDGPAAEGLLLRLRKGLGVLLGVSDPRYLLRLNVLKKGDVALSTFRDKVDAPPQEAWQRFQHTETEDGKPLSILRLADPENPDCYAVLSLQPGMVAMAVSDGGDPEQTASLSLSGGAIRLAASQDMEVDIPITRFLQLLIDNVNGGNGQTVQAMRDTYNSHTHTGDDGGTTSAPHQLQE